MTQKIVTVYAPKGGVGKSTIAYELAWLLDAVLVDLDTDAGGVTGQWGHKPEQPDQRLLDALETGRTPRPLRAKRRPDLVPASPELVMNPPETDELADSLTRWAGEWAREYTVVDTHPGGSAMGFGALSAASLVVMPMALAMRELDALEGSLKELKGYPIMVVPNKVPNTPNGKMLERLTDIVERETVLVGPPISLYTWLPRRQRRAAISATEPAPKVLAPAIAEFIKLSEAVKSYVNS